ncbi:4-hydroxy-3-methylbut-2-enyl diphosphate reductase [Engelhardtia mirabilis]|uniref:4-hydroxy-3-methylbut-2-enyl diphosphate reductase n=1 Tax=Engelhardtia mirabilis TaxID=2528011 RepID=A0A518BSB1_9BACT|nr:4-hydroxy-3-methylbut-2-enyl diphosphate reductase [Planctomycetes bacterium Pla133]QDV04188.1 4-hydroxy-3-methylbut-2-enyl diphosphate reductase [Planctomycetes bacterium Pla86]
MSLGSKDKSNRQLANRSNREGPLTNRFESRDGSVVIDVAESAGYCWGVERAIDLAVESAGDTSRPTVTHGELIHNSYTVDKLRQEYDITHVSNHSEAPDGSALVIRAHGVPPAVKREAAAQGLTVIDGTCPLVDIIHRKAVQLVKEGYEVFVIGQASHPEIIGILASVEEAGGKGTVLETDEDVANVPPLKKAGIVIQSTLIAEKAGKIAAQLVPKSREVKVVNTICHVTTERQEEADHLAATADVILVVGSQHSSNSRKLKEVCGKDGAPTYQIEGLADLDMGWFVGKRHVGIHAGASTPREIIEQIVAHLQEHLVQGAA